MFRAIMKTVGVALGLVVIPIALIVIGIALSIVGPIAGVLLIIFLPIVIAGVIIGYNSAKQEHKEDTKD